jgi:hypothetical protein
MCLHILEQNKVSASESQNYFVLRVNDIPQSDNTSHSETS